METTEYPDLRKMRAKYYAHGKNNSVDATEFPLLGDQTRNSFLGCIPKHLSRGEFYPNIYNTLLETLCEYRTSYRM